MVKEVVDKAVVFDLDGTLITGQSQTLLVNYMFKRGRIGLYDFLRLSWWGLLYKLGIEVDPGSIIRFGIRFLSGWKKENFDIEVEEFVRIKIQPLLDDKVMSILRDRKKAGSKIVIASLAIEPIVKKMAEITGADMYVCTKIEANEGYYTGGITGRLCYGREKADKVVSLLADKNIDPIISAVFADSLSDLDMMISMGEATAVNPRKRMKEESKRRNWDVLVTK